jgi:PAS domain S-box-containing protein
MSDQNQDINELKRDEEKKKNNTKNMETLVEERTKTLIESEEKLRAILTGIGDLITVQNKDLDIIWVNQPVIDIYGDVIGKKCYEVYKGLTEPCFDCYIETVLNEGKMLFTERKIVLPNGKLRHNLQSSSPVRDAKGNIVAMLEIVKDITKRKQLEEDLKRKTVELEALNKELESFSYSVSHDLRAPLRSIDGFSQALLEDYAENLNTQGKDYLQRVRTATQRMAEIIDALLELSRVIRSEIRFEQVDLSEMAQKIVTELQERQPERQVDFIITPGLIVNGDSRLLQLVLENLLGNAWKFTGKQSDAKIEFGIMQPEGERVYFVRDNGAGFEKAYADKLFSAFRRLHSPEEFSGIGIGLATVKRIIHRHGGRVWAEGEVGKGATFYFTL